MLAEEFLRRKHDNTHTQTDRHAHTLWERRPGTGYFRRFSVVVVVVYRPSSSASSLSVLLSLRLLHLLPSENLLLLRHVIAVLHCIQGNAHDNQMNAFNLSVCIAPSMLWAPAPSTPEMEGEGTKKVRRITHTHTDTHTHTNRGCCWLLVQKI